MTGLSCSGRFLLRVRDGQAGGQVKTTRKSVGGRRGVETLQQASSAERYRRSGAQANPERVARYTRAFTVWGMTSLSCISDTTSEIEEEIHGSRESPPIMSTISHPF